MSTVKYYTPMTADDIERFMTQDKFIESSRYMESVQYDAAIKALEFAKFTAQDLFRQSDPGKSVEPYLKAIKYIDFAQRSIEAMKLYTDGTETEARFRERMKGIK